GLIAREMNLSEDEIEILRDAARLHDIRKLAVPNTILNKKGRLTDEEWVIIKTHPAVGADILKSVIFDKQMLAVVRTIMNVMMGQGTPIDFKVRTSVS
ncbi:MAG: HD domain-containing protein, partial [Gammaproteobacteria bacterium]|nr:HD domain-containing protein [Gammaproteobacteria bacterium]